MPQQQASAPLFALYPLATLVAINGIRLVRKRLLLPATNGDEDAPSRRWQHPFLPFSAGISDVSKVKLHITDTDPGSDPAAEPESEPAAEPGAEPEAEPEAGSGIGRRMDATMEASAGVKATFTVMASSCAAAPNPTPTPFRSAPLRTAPTIPFDLILH